jgi:flagellar protein FlgJ
MGFIFGGDTGQSQESVTDARKRLAAAMLQQGTDTSPIQSPWEGAARMAQALMGGLAVRKQGELQSGADAQLISAITGQPYTPPEKPAGFLSSIFGGNKAANPGATGSSMPSADAGGNIPPTKLTDNDVSSGFIDTVKSGYDVNGQKLAVTNPYGLAAIAATGQAESGFSPANVGRTWNDGANDAGGIMSWNGPRLANLQKFAGGTNGTPQQQAQFFLQENPGLIAKLNNAKSVAEAQQIMNNAWAFKGYDQPGNPNAAHRLSLANSYLPRFQGATAGAEESSLNLPASPIQPPPVNPPAHAPTPGYVDPRVMTAGRPDAPPLPAASAPGQVASLDPSVGIPMPGAAGQMRASDPAQPMSPQGTPQAALPPLPSSTVGPAPTVASVPPVDQQQSNQQPGPVRLAQALNGVSPQPAANPMADPRAQALVKAIMNPNASPQVKAMAAQSLQTLMKPPEYGFQTLPDGTVLRSDPRTGTVQPIYQSTPKPTEVNGRLVGADGKVIADFSNGQWERMSDGTLYNKSTGEFRQAPGGAGGEKYYGATVPYYDKDGNLRYRQLSDKGGGKDLDFGPGSTAAPTTRTVDTGTELITLGPGGQEVKRTTKQNYEAAKDTSQGSTEGKAAGEAVSSLPADLMQADQTIKNIDQLLTSKGLDSIVGSVDQFRPSWTMGADGRDALTRLKQLQGGAFLQAYGLLKGGGQITEVEGGKAQDAMARMDRSLDEPHFRAALKDFRDAVEQGVAKMKERAKVALPSAPGDPAVVPTDIPGVTIRRKQ